MARANPVAIALFDDYRAARNAIREIEAARVAGLRIALLANNAGNRYGALPQSGSGDLPREGGVLAQVRGATLRGIGAVVIAGDLVVAGDLVEAPGDLIISLTDAGITREDAQICAEMVRRGGTLVAVRADGQRQRIREILDRYLPIDPASRVALWRAEGWRRFEPDRPPHPGPYYGSSADPSVAGATAVGAPAADPLPRPDPGWLVQRDEPAPPPDHPEPMFGNELVAEQE